MLSRSFKRGEEAVLPRLVVTARLLLGAIYFINGLNWWVKIITPYPSISDFMQSAPPPDVVGAMIQTGILFHLVKATELLAGLALLSGRCVPLMLVVVMPVTVPVFIVDAFFVAHLRGLVMGTGALYLNSVLILAYLEKYRPMLAVRARPDVDPANEDGGAFSLATPIAAIVRPALPVLTALGCCVGLVMLVWLGVMIGQYAVHPLPFGALHPPSAALHP